MTVGDRIRYYRQEKHLSQRNVAEYLGYASQTVFKYEDGTVTNISIPVIEKIAELLEVPPAVLCGWESGDDVRIACALDKLNDEGKAKVVEYAEDLISTGRYKKVSESSVVG